MASEVCRWRISRLLQAAALQLLGVPEVVFGAGNSRFGGCGGVFNVHKMKATENPGAGRLQSKTPEDSPAYPAPTIADCRDW
jgi:tRNA(Arg) A34 adenosine deaminase TadA